MEGHSQCPRELVDGARLTADRLLSGADDKAQVVTVNSVAELP